MGYTSKFKGAEIDARLAKVFQVVDEEANLESLEIEVGGIAGIANKKVTTASLRDLYQPTADDLDMVNMSIKYPEKLSGVTSFEFTTPPEGVTLSQAMAYFVPRTFSGTNQKMVAIMVQSEGIAAMVMTDSYEQIPVMTIANGVATIDQTAVGTLNNVLASDDWCYFGNPEGGEITETQFDVLDLVMKAVSEVETVEVCQKGFAGFSKLAKSDAYTKIKGLESKLDGKKDKPIIAVVNYNTFGAGPGYIYIIHYSSPMSLKINSFDPPAEEVGEYTFYLYNVSTLTLPSDVLWANGILPEMDASKHYELSVVAAKTGDSYIYKAILTAFTTI